MNEKKSKHYLNMMRNYQFLKQFRWDCKHVVAAVVGIVTPGIMIAKVCQLSPSDTTILIQTSLIFSAVATLIQLFLFLEKWVHGYQL